MARQIYGHNLARLRAYFWNFTRVNLLKYAENFVKHRTAVIEMWGGACGDFVNGG